MAFPRITAAAFAIVLIASLALLCVWGVSQLGPRLTHGTNLEHGAGKIIQIDPDRSFVLETVKGQKLHFECSRRCLSVLAHMQRHLRIHANTDVYYIEQPNNILLAEDVD